jgi:regulator of protease activity HflC (stomatin/prohibitin superfamily)
MVDQLFSILTILAWAWFALFVAFIAVRAFQVGGIREVLKDLLSFRVILALIIVLGISLLSVSLVFIEPQEVGVVISVISPDGYREDPLRSGLHFIVPLAERVVRYPIFWQTYTMSKEPFEGENPGDDSITARTSDGQVVYLDSSIIYRIDANEAIRVHIDLQDRYVDDFIRPIMRGVIRTEVSQFTADEVNSSKRKNLEANLEELLRETFSDKGFILDRFLLRNIAFSSQYATAIEQKQVAEQERTQREYQAEQMRKLAEGERDRVRIEAEGKAAAEVLQAEAQAKAILLKAQADAEALRLIAESLKTYPDLVTYRYVEKLAPGIRVMLVPNDNPYLLPLPDLTQNLEAEGTLLPTPTPWITTTVPSSIFTTPTPTQTPTPTPTLTPAP